MKKIISIFCKDDFEPTSSVQGNKNKILGLDYSSGQLYDLLKKYDRKPEIIFIPKMELGILEYSLLAECCIGKKKLYCIFDQGAKFSITDIEYRISDFAEEKLMLPVKVENFSKQNEALLTLNKLISFVNNRQMELYYSTYKSFTKRFKFDTSLEASFSIMNRCSCNDIDLKQLQTNSNHPVDKEIKRLTSKLDKEEALKLYNSDAKGNKIRNHSFFLRKLQSFLFEP